MTATKWSSVWAALVLAATTAGITPRLHAAPKQNADAKAAPDFTLTDQNGKQVSLHQFKGKIVVLEWLNFNCPVSRRHMEAKTMVKLADAYKDKGVVWLGINSSRDTNTQTNKDGAARFGLTYTILDDHTGAVGHAYHARTTPDMFVIDTAGQIVYSGAIDNDPPGENEHPTNYVKQALDELLAGKPVSVPKTRPYGCSVKYAD